MRHPHAHGARQRFGDAGRDDAGAARCSASPPPAATSSTTRTSSITTRRTTSATSAPRRRRSCTRSTTACRSRASPTCRRTSTSIPSRRCGRHPRHVHAASTRPPQPIGDLHVVMHPGRRRSSVHDPRRDTAKQRRPGRTATRSITLDAAARARRDDADVVHGRRFATAASSTAAATTRSSTNGTFFNNFAISRTSATSPNVELQDRNKRRKYGLAAGRAHGRRSTIRRRAWTTSITARRRLDQSRHDRQHRRPTRSRSRPAICRRSGPRTAAATSTTRPPRRSSDFWSYLSARYAGEARHAGTASPSRSTTTPQHPYNVDRMIDGVKKSLDYFTANFSPYQHKQVRILEFPRYAQLRAVVPEHHPVLRVDRLHRRPARQGRHRLRLLRHRARSRAPVVGAPGHRRQRAGRDDARRDDGAVLGADGDGEGVRPRQDAPLPRVRARSLSARPRQRARRRRCR